MSRIGKQPITIPPKVEVTLGAGNHLMVKGPKGQLTMQVHPSIIIKKEDGKLVVERPNDERQTRALHGLTRALVQNMVTGVTTGYRRTLQVEGTGYRVELKGKNLVVYVGYSHSIEVTPPEGISFVVEDRNTIFHVDGLDKQLVGQVAANIRALRPPEPYHGKGIRYKDEVIRRKAGKAGKGK
ncbi:MAG: 50S ribosomal protein L6 [Candidatus Thermofonsia Clade 1 bacterium]|jgi:large subunit ribosomal protein L6|uniref:Large ribosomal subunit protein uL6 n=1 Tax=Candidatus Thermofonsia Clade 1 bacterium TaxID=2364210 RepID=A0A2M8PYK5_9CHLR|nr:MAG: 50S ribosomal protein L6 [Candidatus Thermofonsia Clade 1 bacterium]PJF42638.1 MAG: 50S ribosomal protein L6 [Candidatus Thermofonsia Clade 1 bacterium]RMF51618.1 MAG: 50S ribosomal protein L6 [Chloroflexota bacterium]